MRKFFSIKNVFTTRALTIMAMMIALKVILSQFTIYVTPTFKAVSFAYLPGVAVSILFGPVAGLIFGFIADTVGYFVKPVGPYFVGYALSEMLSYFIYAVFLYKKPISIIRVLLARLTITATITFGLNYLWNVIMYGSAASVYFTSVRLISNLVQLPLYVVLIMVCGRLVLRANKYIGRDTA